MDFISRFIRSVGHLEALLFLYRHRDRTWTAAEISREMRTNVSYAQQQLDDLSATGLLRRPEGSSDGYQYLPVAPELENLVEQVANLYREKRISVINAIYTQPMDRIQSFADAFRIKKD